jgi:methylated-DNA-protein-cysteine methyltransferase-like protein
MGKGTYEKIYTIVRQIPPGKVATYGQVAELAQLPGQARLVGYALHAIANPDTDIPWHRVVNAQGQVSRSPSRYGGDYVQQARLEAEGLVFRDDRLDLKTDRWQPKD